MPPTSGNQKIEPKTQGVAQASGVHYVLVVLGCSLVLLFALGAVANHFGGSSSTEVTTPTKQADGAETTEKKTSSTAWPSDTLLTTLLGSGAVLILVGFLYSRISAITLPGGAKIDLNAKETESGVDAALKTAEDEGTDPAKSVTETLQQLRTVKAEGLELAHGVIAETAGETVKSLAAPGG